MQSYQTRDPARVRKLDADTARLQADLWAIAAAHGTAHRDALGALVVAGMNDVLNSQGYSQAAWWNRIPAAAWTLLVTIALFCNALIGFGARGHRRAFYFILPVALSVTLFLIADIESPLGGSSTCDRRTSKPSRPRCALPSALARRPPPPWVPRCAA